MKMAEFQAVILAAGSGSRMYPLTEKIPKALLQVGNLPLIWYPVNMLEKAGFEEIIVVVLESEAPQISHALSTYCSNTKLKFDFAIIPDDKDMGTADSLRLIKETIERDIVLVSCDLITDVALHHLADIHRTYDASITALLAPIPETNADREAAANPKTKKKRSNNLDQCDYVGIHGDENRLIFFAPGADLEETLIVRKSLLKRYPCINIVTNLMDGHLYIMKKWVIDYLAQNSSISTVKGELIPNLVKKQFQKQNTIKRPVFGAADTSSISVVGDDSKPDLLSFAIEDEIVTATRDLSSWSSSCTTENGNSIRCHTYISEGGLCLRANTLPMYMEANRLIPKQLCNLSTKEITLVHPSATIKPKSQVGGDCMVDESVSVGEKVSVKKSVIGKHTTIGDRVKITNSVIMDHVTIKDGCNIQNSIICNNAYIKDNATLKDCQVGNGFTVNEGGEFKGEALVTDQHLMDFE